MFKNYIKIAFRNITRHRVNSMINLCGLAVGMTSFILIMLYVRYEFSFDTFHQKANNIYRIAKKQPGNVFLNSDEFALTSSPLAPTLKMEYPEVLNATRISAFGNTAVAYNNKNFFDNGLYVDEDFLKIFSFVLLDGDKNTALTGVNKVVISEKIADKLFGNTDPLGKTIIFNNEQELIVSGIHQLVPENSHLQFDMLISFPSLGFSKANNNWLEDWSSNSYYTYFELQKGYDTKNLKEKLSAFIAKYGSEWDRENNSSYIVHPLKDIHLKSHLNMEISQNNDIKNIYLFSFIAFIILIIACINYMNLATSQSAVRAKEVGLRKVAGADRKQLIRQFLGESLFLSFCALLLAIILVEVFLPYFNELSGRQLLFHSSGNIVIYLGLIGVALFTGLVSGSYPAVYLTSFQPVKVLRGSFKTGLKGTKLRNMLVITQFAISIILIICTIIINNQLKYIRNKEVGYNREYLVVMKLRDHFVRQEIPTIKEKLLQNPNVIGVTTSSQLPTFVGSQSSFSLETENGEMAKLPLYRCYVDYDFLELLEIEISEGRNFSKEFSSDEISAAIVNETTARQMGWKVPVGKKVSKWEQEDGEIIGVVKDFHFHSLYDEIKPLILFLMPAGHQYLYARISPVEMSVTIEFLKQTYESFCQTYPFDYFFLDDNFENMYATDQKFGVIFRNFSILAIFIASLGLFGLASFTAENRTKEIGIRKVFGASVPGIVVLLSKQFAKWVVIANLIAFPIAWYSMNRWIQDFAFRIDIGIGVFILAAGISLVIAFVTVSFQAIKAAISNPALTLKCE